MFRRSCYAACILVGTIAIVLASSVTADAPLGVGGDFELSWFSAGEQNNALELLAEAYSGSCGGPLGGVHPRFAMPTRFEPCPDDEKALCATRWVLVGKVVPPNTPCEPWETAP